MGMFDSFYDAQGEEWQTKAMDCNLDAYDIGDRITEPPGDFQMEVIGGPDCGAEWAWVTIRDGVVSEVGVERDPSLPAIAFSGGPFVRPRSTFWETPTEGSDESEEQG